jgi:hypothetical protein
MKSVATDGEKAEYAGALIKMGALTEALAILDSLESKRDTKVLLLKAFAHMAQWDYAGAIPLLREYIDSPGLTLYQRLVGESNLCDSLAFVEDKSAEAEIEKTLEEASRHQFPMITGWVHLSQIDLALTREDVPTAEKALACAEKDYRESTSIESLFVKKWRAIVSLYKNGPKKNVLEELEAVRNEAREKWQDWETIRDCDFHQAVRSDSVELQKYVYYGTSHESFRERLLRHCMHFKPASEPYLWQMPWNKTADTVWEPFSGTTPFRKKLVASGTLNIRLLAALSSDFYRPLRVAALMEQLYPGEFFNDESSPVRIRFAIRQLRTFLSSVKSPLLVEECGGAYRLAAKKPSAILLPRNVKPENTEMDFLKDNFSQKASFTATEVCQAFSVAQRTASRILQEAEAKGLIGRSGKARATVYHWLGPVDKKAA